MHIIGPATGELVIEAGRLAPRDSTKQNKKMSYKVFVVKKMKRKRGCGQTGGGEDEDGEVEEITALAPYTKKKKLSVPATLKKIESDVEAVKSKIVEWPPEFDRDQNAVTLDKLLKERQALYANNEMSVDAFHALDQHLAPKLDTAFKKYFADKEQKQQAEQSNPTGAMLSAILDFKSRGGTPGAGASPGTPGTPANWFTGNATFKRGINTPELAESDAVTRARAVKGRPLKGEHLQKAKSRKPTLAQAAHPIVGLRAAPPPSTPKYRLKPKKQKPKKLQYY